MISTGPGPTGRDLHPDYCPFVHKRCAKCEFALGDGCCFAEAPAPDAIREDYFDMDGNPISLQKLCRQEPAWAANVIATLKRRLAARLAACAADDGCCLRCEARADCEASRQRWGGMVIGGTR
jgi:hypothetical protein